MQVKFIFTFLTLLYQFALQPHEKDSTSVLFWPSARLQSVFNKKYLHLFASQRKH